MGSKEQDELPLIFIHRLPQFNLPPIFTSRLQTLFRIIDPASQSHSHSEESLSVVRALLCLDPAPLHSQTLDLLPSLQCVVATSSGVDHIDLAQCRRRRIAVANAGPAFAADVAEYAVALLIDVLRRLSASHRYVRAGLWPLHGDYCLGSKLSGKRVGIVGLGYIGSEVAKRLQAFDCSISYLSRKKKAHVPFPYYANACDLANDSDILIICCSLTNETYHLINKDVMTALGKKGVIINVARGAVVDEKELVQFLVRGHIGGAGLDVFENEPDVPKELFELDNVVLSPHKAVATPESLESLLEVNIANLEAFFSNKPLLSLIDLE